MKKEGRMPYADLPIVRDDPEFLREIGIADPPPTTAARRSLIRYVMDSLHGGKTRQQRARTLADTWHAWCGKRVRQKGTKIRGRVLYLRARSRCFLGPMRSVRMTSLPVEQVTPFEAQVRTDSGRLRTFGLNTLELIDE